ncbi:MAG: hypothetical protein WA652_15245 [Xanthobacteraceae bacterium]|jgi:uncharacterized protein YjiS (DUF1127 family)
MTIFLPELARLPELIAGNFMRWRYRKAGAKLENLSSRSLEDIGVVEPPKRDLDAVKPFWMP